MANKEDRPNFCFGLLGRSSVYTFTGKFTMARQTKSKINDKKLSPHFGERFAKADQPALEEEEIIEAEDISEETCNELDNSVQLYLKTIGKIPLLTADEEIEIARQIATEDQEVSQKACNRLVKANLRLVVSIAKRYATQSIPLLDLIQEGNTGLTRAARKFDHELGYRFSTYATWWIKQAIMRSINEKEKSIRIPAHALEQINRLKKTVDKLTREYGRPPTDEELNANLDFSASDVHLWQGADIETLSLEAPIGKENEGTLNEIITDLDEKTPEYEMQKKALRNDLMKSLEFLDEEEKIILELRFGFNRSEKFYSIEEVSEMCNVSRDKVRKIEFKALRKLKNLIGTTMKDYLYSS